MKSEYEQMHFLSFALLNTEDNLITQVQDRGEQ